MAFENYWALSQSQATVSVSSLTNAFGAAADDDEFDPESFISDDLELPSLPGTGSNAPPPLVVTGYVHGSGSTVAGTYPVTITSGSNDHSFKVVVDTSVSEISSAAGATAHFAPFYNASQIGGNYFFDSTLGVIKKTTATPWIKAVNVGWCYPDTSAAPDIWFYSLDDDDWYYLPADDRGMLFKQRTQAWYYLDPVTFRHIPFNSNPVPDTVE